MSERLIVKNNSGTVLRLNKFKFTMHPNQTVDLVYLSGKSIIDIKRDPDIMREISHNNLSIVEEFSPQPISSEMEKRLEEIILLLKTQQNNPVVVQQIVSGGEVKEAVKDNEEETMRENALMILLGNKEGKETKNIENLGKKKEIKGTDDFSNLIDF